MNLKDRIFSLFKYKSPEKHDFVLLEDDESDKSSNSSQSIKNDTNEDINSQQENSEV